MPRDLLTTKTCSRCTIERDATAFARSQRHRGGLAPWCRDCMRAYKVENAAKYAARAREYVAANADRIRESRRAYREKNMKRILEWNRDWRARNPERYRASMARAYRTYRQRYPLKAIVKAHRRLARKRGRPFQWSVELAGRALEFFGGRCAVCREVLGRGRDAHWDHWIPWRSTSCPGTVASNMVPLCRGCNLSKNACDPETWLQDRHAERAVQVLQSLHAYQQEIAA